MRAIPRQQFEDLVREALAGLPEEFLARLDNVDVVVADNPAAEQLEKNGIGPDGTLFGLYEGIPLTERHDYSLVVPDKITIFQRPLEGECATEEELIAEVRATVVHEVAHFFGIGDEALEQIGLA